MTRQKEERYTRAAVLLGRLLQTGMMFFINLAFMFEADVDLYIETGVAMAWAGPLSAATMLGGYISATQINANDGAADAEFLQAYLVYRPILLLCLLVGSLHTVAEIDSSFFFFILIFSTFLVLGGIADIFLFYKKISVFILVNTLLSLLVCLTSFSFLGDFSNLIIVEFIWITATAFLIFLLTRCGIVTWRGIEFFVRNFRFFLIKNIANSVVVLVSSLSLGVFLVADRLLLPYFMGVSELANYLAATTLALPIHFLAVIYGKYTLLENFYSRLTEKVNFESSLVHSFFLFCLGLIVLPIQSQILNHLTEYEFNVFLQGLINLAGCLIVLSKQYLAQIYAQRRQKIVSVMNLFLIISMLPALIYFASGLEAIGVVRFSFNIIYVFMIVCLSLNLTAIRGRS